MSVHGGPDTLLQEALKVVFHSEQCSQDSQSVDKPGPVGQAVIQVRRSVIEHLILRTLSSFFFAHDRENCIISRDDKAPNKGSSVLNMEGTGYQNRIRKQIGGWWFVLCCLDFCV